MPPIRTYANRNTRASDNEPAIEPYRNISLYAKAETQRHGTFKN